MMCHTVDTRIFVVTSYHFVCLPHVLVHLLRLGGVVVALGARLVRLAVVAVLQKQRDRNRIRCPINTFIVLLWKEGRDFMIGKRASQTT